MPMPRYAHIVNIWQESGLPLYVYISVLIVMDAQQNINIFHIY